MKKPPKHSAGAAERRRRAEDGLRVRERTTELARANEAPPAPGFFGVIRDLTELNRAQEALKESETRLRALFDNMLEGVAFCRMLFEDGRLRDFVYIEVNDAKRAGVLKKRPKKKPAARAIVFTYARGKETVRAPRRRSAKS